jgi:hypothetical protein
MVHTIARVIILFCQRPPAKIEDRSKCCTMVQLSKVFLSAALLICFSSTSEAQGCTARVLSDYMDCVAANPCECAECDPDPTDDSPLIPVNRPEDCLDVARIYCPLIKCCSICEEEAFGWFQCTANGFSTSLLGTTCPLDNSCDSYPLQDVDCDPTASPVESGSPTTSPTKGSTDVPIIETTELPSTEPTLAPASVAVVEEGTGTTLPPTTSPTDVDLSPDTSGSKQPCMSMLATNLAMLTLVAL